MSKRKKPKIPWPVNEYYVDEENKVIWLMGSFMRSMMLANRREEAVPGYEIKLCQQKYIHELKVKHYDKKETEQD